MRKFIENFPPSWFACTMGTGILAVTSYMYSSHLPWLKGFAFFIFYFNVVYFFFLLVPWILRWFMFKDKAMADLYHPINSNFYPTLGVGMLVIAAGALVLLKNTTMGWYFWSIGSAVTVFFAFLTPFLVFKSENVETHHLNPAWFIPPVGLIVIPIAGSKLTSLTSGSLHSFLLAFNFFAWGAGFFLYLSLHAAVIYRFITHKTLPGVLAPTFLINLGPVGAGSVSLLALVKVVDPSFIKFTAIFCSFLWGLGIWWLVMSALMIGYYFKSDQLKFAMSWWAFTFPLGAFIAASYNIGHTLNVPFIQGTGFVLLWVLMIIWAVTLVRSIATNVFGVLRS